MSKAEDAEIMSVSTGGKATLSQYTAIQRLDDMSAADTDAELAMIRSDDTYLLIRDNGIRFSR